MKLLTGAATAAQEDLGGGFVYARRPDGASVVVASRLAEAGALGVMMPAPKDARADADLSAWVAEWKIGSSDDLRALEQVHSADVVPAAAAATSQSAPRADGIWTDSAGDLLLIRHADCAPVWIVEPDRGLLAMLHAGWRGVAAGIVSAGVRALREAHAETAKMKVAIGPHLRPCCFEVGPEVAELFAQTKGAILPAETLTAPRQRSNSVAFDLAAAIVAAFAAAGVEPEHIDTATACTRCRSDIFHSYRRNGPGGPLMASVGRL